MHQRIQNFGEYVFQDFIQDLERDTNCLVEFLTRELAVKIAEPYENELNKHTIYFQVNKFHSEFREEWIVGELIEIVQEYRNVFIVYGKSHIPRWSDALSDLTNSKPHIKELDVNR